MASTEDRFPSTKDLRNLSVEELENSIAKMRKELVIARCKLKTARLEKTSDIKSMRRSIARMETIMTEKKKG